MQNKQGSYEDYESRAKLYRQIIAKYGLKHTVCLGLEMMSGLDRITNDSEILNDPSQLANVYEPYDKIVFDTAAAAIGLEMIRTVLHINEDVKVIMQIYCEKLFSNGENYE